MPAKTTYLQIYLPESYLHLRTRVIDVAVPFIQFEDNICIYSKNQLFGPLVKPFKGKLPNNPKKKFKLQQLLSFSKI